MKLDNAAKARFLARRLFNIGDDNRALPPVTRIQFKAGEWPDKEISLGGLCEESLATVLREALDDIDKEC